MLSLFEYFGPSNTDHSNSESIQILNIFGSPILNGKYKMAAKIAISIKIHWGSEQGTSEYRKHLNNKLSLFGVQILSGIQVVVCIAD